MRVSMERWWNDNDGGKPKYSEINLAQLQFARKIALGLVRDRIRGFPVREQRLTA